VEEYYANYDADVQQTLVELGFTGVNQPIQTYQGSDCIYEESSDDSKAKSADDDRNFSMKDVTIVVSVGAVVAVSLVAIVGFVYIRRKNTSNTAGSNRNENLLSSEQRESELSRSRA
jgi:Mn2+/Fe2+ NRAMP family transporter